MSGFSMAAVLTALMAAAALGAAAAKRRIFTSMYQALYREEYELFFKKADSRAARALLPKLTRESLKLNAYMKQGQTGAVTRQFNICMKLSPVPFQKSSLLAQGFDYYSHCREAEKCRRILSAMDGVLAPERRDQYRRRYEALFGEIKDDCLSNFSD